MKIDEAKSINLVPRFMADDKTVKGFCAVMDFFIGKICEKLPLVNLYENLDMLEEADLDYIASMDEIEWYDTSYSVEQKIRIIQNHEKNCMFLGTKQSIEGVIQDIFGMGEEVEWFDYDSQAYLFKIITSALLTESTDELLTKIVKKVKTSKSKLEYVQVQRDISGDQYIGVNTYSYSIPACIVEE